MITQKVNSLDFNWIHCQLNISRLEGVLRVFLSSYVTHMPLSTHIVVHTQHKAKSNNLSPSLFLSQFPKLLYT